MIIAGVSVDLLNLPNREIVLSMATNSLDFFYLENKEEVINEILDNSGLWTKEEVILKNEEDVLPRVDDKTFRKNKR